MGNPDSLFYETNCCTYSIKELWSPMLKGWFGDLKDGKHTGDWDDPRVAVIQVVPAEIRYVRDFNVLLYHHLTLLTSVWTQWIKTESSLAQTYELVKGAVTGETASPGALRVITESEVSFCLNQIDRLLMGCVARTREEAGPEGDLRHLRGTRACATVSWSVMI